MIYRDAWDANYKLNGLQLEQVIQAAALQAPVAAVAVARLPQARVRPVHRMHLPAIQALRHHHSAWVPRLAPPSSPAKCR